MKKSKKNPVFPIGLKFRRHRARIRADPRGRNPSLAERKAAAHVRYWERAVLSQAKGGKFDTVAMFLPTLHKAYIDLRHATFKAIRDAKKK